MVDESTTHPRCALRDVLITDQVALRPSRSPDYQAEAQALSALAEALTSEPGGLLQQVVETAMVLCRADSAGVTILEAGGAQGIFRWHAVAGRLASQVAGTLPREASPCGEVLSRNSLLLFNQAERYFPALRSLHPPMYENLLAPWAIDGQPAGTLWVISHNPGRQFDAEDARLLASVARFAAAAWRQALVIQASQACREAVSESERHQAFLLRLSDRLRRLSEPRAIMTAAVEALGRHLGLSSVWYCLVEADQATAAIAAAYNDGRLPLVVPGQRFQLGDLGTGGPALRSGLEIVVEDTRTSEHELVGVPQWSGLRAAIAIPLSTDGRLVACLYAGHAEPRVWREGERQLQREVAERTRAALEQARVETALREREEQYRTLFGTMLEGFCVIEMIFDAGGRPVDFRFIEVNSVFAERSGLHDALDKSMRDLVPDLEENWFEFYGRVALTGEPMRFVNQAKRLDRWYDIYAYRLGGPDSCLVAVMFNDITQHKRTEEALRDSERHQRELAVSTEVERARLAAVLGSLPVGVWIADEHGQLIGKNEAADRIWAGHAPLLKGIEDYRQYTAWYAETGERLSAEEYPMAKALRKCQPVEPVELHIRRFDGSDGTILVSAIPILNAQGRLSGAVSINVDITDRKRAEEQLRRTRDAFFSLVQDAPFGVYVVDQEFRLQQVNAGAQAVFRNVRPSVGRDFAEALRIVWPEPFATEAIGHFRQTLETGVSYVAPSTTHRRQDTGQVEWYEWQIHRVTLPDGQYGVVCYFYESTHIRRVEQALRESEERLRALSGQLEQLVGERTGELVQSQQRLRALASELNLAEQRERKRLAAELHDHLQQMLVLGKLKLGQGKRLVNQVPACAEIMKQVDDVLTEALRYTRTLVTELSPPVLRDHGLAAGLKWLGEYMKKQDMAVTVTVPEEQHPALPEEQAVLLFQSVRELLINAWKYAKTGEAMVRLEEKAGHLRIEVRDEGVGCDFSADAPLEETSSGVSSKFGLFSIRERMTALGGSFEMTSAPGRGTTATLVLPLGVSAAGGRASGATEDSPCTIPPSVPKQAHGVTHPASRLRVLLVDDHVMVRQGLRSVLDGYADVEVVGEAGGGQEAIALAAHLRPAVVVMDINMPQMNGIEATRVIRSRYAETVVVGLSVNAGEENRDAMMAAGAAVLMTKEAAVEQLYSTIQEALRAK